MYSRRASFPLQRSCIMVFRPAHTLYIHDGAGGLCENSSRKLHRRHLNRACGKTQCVGSGPWNITLPFSPCLLGRAFRNNSMFRTNREGLATQDHLDLTDLPSGIMNEQVSNSNTNPLIVCVIARAAYLKHSNIDEHVASLHPSNLLDVTSPPKVPQAIGIHSMCCVFESFKYVFSKSTGELHPIPHPRCHQNMACHIH